VRKGWIFGIVAAAVILIIGVAIGVAALFAPAAIESSASGDSSTTSGAPVESDSDFGTVEVYTVLGDASLDPQPTGLTADIWETFTRLATPEVAASIVTEYRVGNSATSDTVAYVYQSDDPTRWVLAANLAGSEDTCQLIATLVHEYAHILTLSVDQLAPSTDSCPTLALDEGCADPNAVIETFNEQFWVGYGDAAPSPANTDSDLAYSFYLEHEEDFVSDYAATNVVEDIAESFMTFVISDQATGQNVAAQKLQFFESYPQYVELRDRIRAEFVTELGL
jgi:hypothetical protein